MKNKNRIFRIASLLLVLCFISTVMISGTFAKYTSEYSGSDTALVARWSFTVDNFDEEETEELNFFEHEYEQYINKMGLYEKGDDPEEEDIMKYIIAPGVEGEFTLEMEYLADVDADVTIDIDLLEDSAAVPVEYSVSQGEGEDVWVSLDGLEAVLMDTIAENYSLTTLEEGEEGEEETIGFVIEKVANDSYTATEISQTVKWRWAYEREEDGSTTAADAEDTGLGEAFQDAAANLKEGRTFYGIKVTITATQIAPGIEEP